MNSTPTPAALEAARKCLARLPPEHDNGSGPEPCLSCDADRQEYLAAAFEAFAADYHALRIPYYGCIVERSKAELIAEANKPMPLHQEDASDAH